MRINRLITFLFAALLLSSAARLLGAQPDPYAPLWQYNGTWRVTHSGTGASAKPDTLVNECSRIGKYFGCQQTVNGSVVALVLLIPAEKPGHYYNQSILPGGRATGLGDLEIDGDRWTFRMGRLEGGKTMNYRTVNTFSGRTKIHFEQAESADGKEWKVTGSGDEVKLAGPSSKAITTR